MYGTTLSAGVHTHGKDPRMPGVHVNNFSSVHLFESLGRKGDIKWVNQYGVPLYLSNPRGELKIYNPKPQFVPGDENGQVIREDMPYDIYLQAPYYVQPRRPAYNPDIVYKEDREPLPREAIPYKLPAKSN